MPDRTLVYQSFRTDNVPCWMTTCMDSVRAWTDLKGYEYRFVDDSFFGYVPDWFREAVNGQRHLVSDLARLELAREYLDEGWDRVVWLDADTFIVEPQLFQLDDKQGVMVSRELWMAMRNDQVMFFEGANNSVMAFRKGEPFLPFYIEACKRIVRSRKGDFPHMAIGTKFLTGLSHRLPKVFGAVTFSPLNLVSLYSDDRHLVDWYFEKLCSPIYAVNLCLTFRGMTYRGLLINDQVFTQIMDTLAGDGYQKDGGTTA